MLLKSSKNRVSISVITVLAGSKNALLLLNTSPFGKKALANSCRWFTLPFSHSERWVIAGEVVVAILLMATIVLSMRRAGTRMGKVFLSTVFCLVLLLVIPAVNGRGSVAAFLLLNGRMFTGDTPANAFLLVGLSVLGAVIGGAVLGKLRRYLDLQELSLGGLVVACILSWVIVLLLPAGSYLLFWPLLLTTVGLLLLDSQKPDLDGPGCWAYWWARWRPF